MTALNEVVPVTPFHFGPGTLVKAIFPHGMSLTAFVLSQIAIDLESGYHLLCGDWPVHREVHSFLGASVVGLLTGAAVWVAARRLRSSDPAIAQAEIGMIPALVGGLIGGLSHPILDGIMHPDLRPFWPLSSANPFLGILDLGVLHLLCVVSGLAGMFVLAFRARETKAG